MQNGASKFDRSAEKHALPKFNPSVGDIYRLPTWGGIFRVWRVTAVKYGSANQESVVEMQTIDRHAYDGELRIPIDIMEAANPEKL